MAETQVAPLRSFSDFTSRFQIPQIQDFDRWANRVLNNLLYYQTNYFLSALIIFLVIGVMHPVKMVLGFSALAIAFGSFVYGTNNHLPARQFKRKHPLISIAIIMAAGYLVVYMFGAVIVFLFGIAFPLLLILLHASLRVRNIKNKISNKMETVGLKRTPMGIILEGLGHEQDTVS